MWLLAVTIPAMLPSKLQSGPPLFPGLTRQSVTMNPDSSSLSGMELAIPWVTVGVVLLLPISGNPRRKRPARP